MIIESVRVKNYRSILDETLCCESLTALVGANGTGKSSFLKALDLFYSPSPKIDAEDFYNGDVANEIVVAITFNDLSKQAKGLFSDYIENSKLTIERVFVWDVEKAVSKYHGATLQNTEFQVIRNAASAAIAKTEYEKLRLKSDYTMLPRWSSREVAEDNLKQWEIKCPNKCTRLRDDGRFFSFKEGVREGLGKFTRFLYIPAVHDASDDATDERGSVLTELMDLVVRNALANKDALKTLQADTQSKYQIIMDPNKLTELGDLASQMTKTLKTFVPDAKVDLQWLPLPEVQLPMPQVDVKLVEDGYSSAVVRTGHGLQRAFIITMLQHLALAQTSDEPNFENITETGSPIANKLPNLVLVVEEPELYQHPNRQRHLAKIFIQLAGGKTPGVAEKTQIVYGTHSPLFVGIERIDQVRLLRKMSIDASKPKITKVVSTTLDKIAGTLWTAIDESGSPFTHSTILPRLKAIMTPQMNEGFFADVVVLVEGEDDRAAILGVAKTMGHELESMGCCVIPCGGKSNMDRPYVIFKQLGIPVYMVWDGDYCASSEIKAPCEKCGHTPNKKADPKANRRLLKLIGKDEIDWPACVEDNYACFKHDLETTMREEIGNELFERCLAECQSDFHIKRQEHALKNPDVIMTIVNKAKSEGRSISTINKIVEKIVALRGKS